MAKNYTEILALANKNNMGLSNTIKRDYGIPLDYSSVQENYEAALAYAQTSTLAYIGQPISVGDVLYVVTTAEEGYLKQVGTKPAGDNKSIEVSEEGVVSIKGYAAAPYATLPQKKLIQQDDGTSIETIEWVSISSIVEGDGNTKTVVRAADDSVITVTPVHDDANDTYTYTLDVTFPAIPEYTVTKTVNDNDVTYKVTKDGVAVGESIVVPNAYNDSEVRSSIGALEGHFTNGVANSAKDYAAEGGIATEFSRLAGLIDGLSGVDTGFTQQLADLEQEFDAFMAGTGAADVIDSLSDIRDAIEALQTHTTSYETKVDGNADDIAELSSRLTAVEGIAHHDHANKAELDKITEGKVASWDGYAATIAGLSTDKVDKSYVDSELAKKVDVEGYVAYSQAEKEKLAGLENFDSSELAAQISDLEGKFDASGKANDAAKLGGQAPDYYATASALTTAVSAVDGKIEGAIAAIPVATTSVLGLVRASESIAVSTDGVMSVAKVSTDVLEQGTETLILNGGSASN